MYPQSELTRLAAHKGVFRRASALHRAQCAAAAARLAQPVAWIDQMLATWQRLAPLAQLAAAPLAVLAARAAWPRLKFLGPLVRWAPVLFSAAHGLGAALKGRTKPQPVNRRARA